MGFSSPDLLFFMRERTLMAQRLDLNRLELTGEPIRVAEGSRHAGVWLCVRRFRERYAGVLGWRPDHYTADVVPTRRHGCGHIGIAGRIHEHCPLVRWAAGGGRSVRSDAWDLAPRHGARQRDESDVRRRLRVDACLVAGRGRLRVLGGGEHAAEPVFEAGWHGRRRRNGCSEPRPRPCFRKAGLAMDASSRT